MKKSVMLIMAVVVYNFSSSQRIYFKKEKLAGILKEAKEKQKFVFIDCYTAWCGPCKKLDKNVFTQKNVAIF